MNILFLHRSFPAQFKYLALELAQDKSNKVFYITNSDNFEIEGIKKIIYQVPSQTNRDNALCKNPLVESFASAIEHGKAAAAEAQKLKEQGFKPDIIYAHSGWGVGMFMKDVFPETPLICYCEWFQNAIGSDIGFLKEEVTDYQKEGIRCANSQILLDLQAAEGGISPTNWQKKQFPKEFQNKIKVLHDGVDTDFFKPDKNAEFMGFTQHDEVITYATRGMEPYRGFEQFMQAAEKILKQRPNVHIIIAGEDKVFYRKRLEHGTYKELMLKKLDLDESRIHFTGILPYEDYLKLLQISSVHVYLTVPYVLSWSCMDAMSTGCCVVASNTQPVQEVIKDNENGILCSFFKIDDIVKKINYALDNKNKMQEIRQSARQIILDKYSCKKLIPEQIKFLKSKHQNNRH